MIVTMFRYYIVQDDGEILKTNDEAVAQEFSEYDMVIDTEEGNCIGTRAVPKRVDIKEVTELPSDVDSDD